MAREVDLVRNAKRRHVRIEVGSPLLTSEGNWDCQVALVGLHGRLTARGIDGFQALVLALRLVRQLLEAEVGRGSALHWGGGPISVADLFSESDAPKRPKMGRKRTGVRSGGRSEPR